MILVEGPDGSGKSTLVSKLTERYGELKEVLVEDRDRMADTTKERTYLALADEVESNPMAMDLVYDRLFFSELIYGPLWREKGANVFSVTEINFVMQLLAVLKVPIIVCLPRLDTVIASLGDNQLPKVKRTLESVYIGYQRLARNTSLTTKYLTEEGTASTVMVPVGMLSGRIYRYDWEYDSFDRLCRFVDSNLNHRKARTWQRHESS